MKCRACWTDKAYVREVGGWRGVLYTWLGMVPLKCHHCYHRFSVPWFVTIGKRLTPPVIVARPLPPTAAADGYATAEGRKKAELSSSGIRRAA